MDETTALSALDDRFAARQARLGIIGLGYVGLPLALTAVEAGFAVTGFDISAARVAAIAGAGQVISYIPAARLAAARDTGRFQPTTDMALMADCDALILCVPTPLTRQQMPDLSYIEATSRQIAATLRPGQLVVLESTTWPGTTDEVVRPILEAGGLRSGHDFFLAYSPEREDPGSTHALAAIPKVVGADDPGAARLVRTLYGQLAQTVVPVPSSRAAEAVKLTENIFRAVNIALVNELKTIYSAMGIDVWDVIEAASSKPFGYMPFYPGPGLGGHCIPIDPFYLTWKAREFDVESRFIELAGQINTRMPHLVVDALAQALDRRHGRGLAGARVLVAGIAYKRNIDDIRESPALRLMELLGARGAVCSYTDPLVAAIPRTREHASLAGMTSITPTAESLAACDAVLLATDHDALDYPLIAAHARLIVDTRNAFAKRGLGGVHVVKA